MPLKTHTWLTLALFGTDIKYPRELDSEVEIWYEDEKHLVTIKRLGQFIQPTVFINSASNVFSVTRDQRVF